MPVSVHETRPRINPALTLSGRLIDVASIVFTLSTIGITVYFYPSLPGIVPHHFDLAGNPDAYGDKLFVWFIPAIGVFLTVLLTVVGRYPHTFNFPVHITAKNAERQYRLATWLLRWVKFWLSGFFLYAAWNTLKTSLGVNSILSIWSVLLLVVLLTGTIGIYICFSITSK